MRRSPGRLPTAATMLAAGALTALALAPAHAATAPMTLTPDPAHCCAPGHVGLSYGQGLTALGGGRRPVTWTVVAGSLPAGLSIIKDWGNSSTMITGRPTRPQTATFTVQGKDKDGNSVQGVYTITVTP